jgi:hypothetical protein
MGIIDNIINFYKGAPKRGASAAVAKSPSSLLQTRNPDWALQASDSKLCNDLMGGTKAMRLARTEYLPKKGSETDADYAIRLAGAFLDNFYQKTIIFYLGQVFKKELRYQDDEDKAAKKPYDADWFEEFKENVDLAGNNLTVFGKQVFQAGLVDGVTFVLTDYSGVKSVTDPETGQLLYKDENDGSLKPKTLAADEKLNQRPYFIHVKASQVLDAWTGIENGELKLKHFRYEEIVESPNDADGLDRETVSQIIAWWPHKWEKWEVRNSNATLIDYGPNSLGEIPVVWFRPGEPTGTLTARPPLDDLAEMNRAYWAATADHDGRLMPFVRSPAALAVGLGIPEGQQVQFSPARIIETDNPQGRLESIGIDSASAVNSQNDLREKRDAMRDYGLQTVQSGVTATMSENVATNAASSLKGWCAVFKDCLENAHYYAARYQGWEDGPAIVVNMEFKNSLDLNLLGHLQQAVTAEIIVPKFYVQQLLSMLPYSDEWTDEDALNPNFGKETEYEFPEYTRTQKTPVGEKIAPVGER